MCELTIYAVKYNLISNRKYMYILAYIILTFYSDSITILTDIKKS